MTSKSTKSTSNLLPHLKSHQIQGSHLWLSATLTVQGTNPAGLKLVPGKGITVLLILKYKEETGDRVFLIYYLGTVQLYRPCPGRTQDKPKKESSSVLIWGNPALPTTRGFLLFWEQWKSANLSYNTKRSALRLYYFHLFSFVSANSTSENGESPLKPIYWLQREPVFLMHLFCWVFCLVLSVCF